MTNKSWHEEDAWKLVDKLSKEDMNKSFEAFRHMYLGHQNNISDEMKELCKKEVREVDYSGNREVIEIEE